MGKPQVGVITLVDLKNYGNRLQNFAVHQLLEQRALQPLTIEITDRPLRARARDAYYAVAKDLRDARSFEGRARAFWQFSREHVPHAPMTARMLQRHTNRFSFFVFGSDQVWNPNDARLGGRLDGAQCMPNVAGRLKVTASPSFGLADISPEWRERYAQWLRTFDDLAVREHAGADLVENLVGVRPRVLVDPTMAIEPDTWRSQANATQLTEQSYVLKLTLGDRSPDREARLERFATRHGLQIVDLGNAADPVARRCGPRDFIDLVDRAALVVTDSFHCAVFAVMLGSSLALSAREGAGSAMASRLQTLSDNFRLSNRALDSSATEIPDDLLTDNSHTERLRHLASLRSDFLGHFDAGVTRASA